MGQQTWWGSQQGSAIEGRAAVRLLGPYARRPVGAAAWSAVGVGGSEGGGVEVLVVVEV